MSLEDGTTDQIMRDIRTILNTGDLAVYSGWSEGGLYNVI